MSRINILGNNGADDVTSVISSYYDTWRNTNQHSKRGFLALFNDFRENGYLRDLEPGPLRLYLYFGLSADNKYGHSWPSIETIAKYFNKQTRTIDYWLQQLSDAGLIYRERSSKKSSTTYLIPYGNTIMRQRPSRLFEEDSQSMFDNLIKVVEKRKVVYGPIVGVYHLFHWASRRGKPSLEHPASNIIFIVTRRDIGVLIGHLYQLKNSDGNGISTLSIHDPVAFSSPFVYMGHPVQGIAVRHTHRLKPNDNFKTWLDLLNDLSQADESVFADYPVVDYGPIDDVLDMDELQQDDSSEAEQKAEDGTEDEAEDEDVAGEEQ